MSDAPEHLRYAKSHEWVRLEGDIATVGISDHAQKALNDIVYVDLPAVGKTLAAGEEFGVVESVKSVSEVYAPVAGTVTAANTGIEDTPETVNDDPYGAGWLIKIQIADPAEVDALMSAAGYLASLE